MQLAICCNLEVANFSSVVLGADIPFRWGTTIPRERLHCLHSEHIGGVLNRTSYSLSNSEALQKASKGFVGDCGLEDRVRVAPG